MDPGLQLADGIEFFLDDYNEDTQDDDDFVPSFRMNAFAPLQSIQIEIDYFMKCILLPRVVDIDQSPFSSFGIKWMFQ